MKVTLDFDHKTIFIHKGDSLAKLSDRLKNMLPDYEDWKLTNSFSINERYSMGFDPFYFMKSKKDETS